MNKDEFKESSGNVFEDMGLDDSDELLARSQLGHAVRMILKEKGWKQGEICRQLGIDQGEVSKLVNGKYHLFSEKRLFGFLNKLNKQVILTVVDRPKGEPVSQVVHS